MIKLSEYAKRHGISYMTAYRYFHQGYIPGKQYPTGTILIEDESFDKVIKTVNKKTSVILYARVSSSENKSNLESQMDRLRQYASAKGYVVSKEIKEIGSGLNDKRTRLSNILKKENEWDKIIVEHKDRLARFGVNYMDILLKNQGREIEIINNSDTDKEDIMQDFVSVITSFCAKIYGLRRSKRKTEQIIQQLSVK